MKAASAIPSNVETGAAIVNHPGVDKIAFTGSTAAGKAVAARLQPYVTGSFSGLFNGPTSHRPQGHLVVYAIKDLAAARAHPAELIEVFIDCPVPEVARLGRTLASWRKEYLAYFDTDGVSNGGTEAINGLIELHRRIARGLTNFENYRLRMLRHRRRAGLLPPHRI